MQKLRQGVANATYASVFEFGIAAGITATGWFSQFMGFEWIYLASALWLLLTAWVFYKKTARQYERARRLFETKA